MKPLERFVEMRRKGLIEPPKLSREQADHVVQFMNDLMRKRRRGLRPLASIAPGSRSVH